MDTVADGFLVIFVNVMDFKGVVDSIIGMDALLALSIIGTSLFMISMCFPPMIDTVTSRREPSIEQKLSDALEENALLKNQLKALMTNDAT